MFEYRLIAQDPETGARAGEVTTPHGVIPTPVFMPVGTQATVKAMSPDELKQIGAKIILSNTYHLFLRPGPDLIAKAGGLHGFMNWDRPILTDSGGFQVFSLAGISKVMDDGVEFQSHLDGTRYLMTPELATQIQEKLGSDIAMCFDQCVKLPCTREQAQAAVERTLRWAARCKAAHSRADQAQFGIVQGALLDDLRAACADELVRMDFPGYAIGGLSVGESHAEMYRCLDALMPRLPAHKPRYLMGVGHPANLIEGIARGVDMFDCVLPTRVHLRRQDERQTPALRRRLFAHRPRVRLLRLPQLHARLRAPPLQGRRDPGGAAAFVAQHSFPRPARGRRAAGHRRRALRRLPPRVHDAVRRRRLP